MQLLSDLPAELTFPVCSGEIIESGYLNLNFDGNIINELVIDGQFNLSYPDCEYEQLTIIGVSPETGKVSSLLTYTNTTTIATGPVSVCEDSDEFLIADNPFGEGTVVHFDPNACGCPQTTGNIYKLVKQ